MNRLIVLSGPSCAGKGPLFTALDKFYPELLEKMRKIVMYNSRSPRPHEQEGRDYYFRNRDYVESLRADKNYIVQEIRNDLQAVNLNQLHELLDKGDVYFEGNPAWLSAFKDHAAAVNVKCLSIFLSPLDAAEITYLLSERDRSDLHNFVAELMRTKLLRRTHKQKGTPSLKILENIETRAGSAWDEIKEAVRYEWVIPDHDGEDSDNWNRFYYPIGDARKTMLAFVELLQNGFTELAEQWDGNLFNQ